MNEDNTSATNPQLKKVDGPLNSTIHFSNTLNNNVFYSGKLG